MVNNGFHPAIEKQIPMANAMGESISSGYDLPVGINSVSPFAQNGGAGLYPIPDRHLYFRIDRKIDIQPRSKTDHAETLPTTQRIPFLHPADDSSGHQAGNLNKSHLLAVRALQQKGVVLVFSRGLVEIGGKNLPG